MDIKLITEEVQYSTRKKRKNIHNKKHLNYLHETNGAYVGLVDQLDQ